MKKWLALLLCLVAPLAATMARAAEPIKIGAIFSVTGPASFLGEPEKNTAKMLEEEINKAGGVLGRPLEVVVYDDESDPTKAVTAIDRLIKMDGVVAVIGPSTTGSSLAVAPKAIAAKIPLISCAAAKKIVDPVNPWVFKTPQHDALVVNKLYQHLQATGLKKVAILTASDAFGTAGRAELKDTAGKYGITVVADEVFGPKDTDMTAQLTKIKGTDAQAIICWGTNPGPAVIARNRVQLGITTPLFMSHGVASKKFIELAGAENAEGLVIAAGAILVVDKLPADHPQKKILETYRKDYETKFGGAVSSFGGHAWDALTMAVQAMKTANSAEPAAIRDALENIKACIGTAGEFNLSATDHCGLTESALVLITIKKGDWELLK